MDRGSTKFIQSEPTQISRSPQYASMGVCWLELVVFSVVCHNFFYFFLKMQYKIFFMNGKTHNVYGTDKHVSKTIKSLSMYKL